MCVMRRAADDSVFESAMKQGAVARLCDDEGAVQDARRGARLFTVALCNCPTLPSMESVRRVGAGPHHCKEMRKPTSEFAHIVRDLVDPVGVVADIAKAMSGE